MPVVVSVIIPFYRGAAFLAEAVESALAQTYPAVEVIVVDDGSPEPPEPVLARFGDRIRLVKQQNRGVAGARNTGVREARGELIALLDQDDAWLPTKLERQVRALEEQPDAVFVHSGAIIRNERAGQVLSMREKRASEAFVGDCYERLFLGNRITTCTLVCSRARVIEVGLFDESIHATDDFDLELRLARRGPVAYVAEPLAVYRVHDGNESWRIQSMRRNELSVVEKTLREDPGLWKRLGRAIVRKRLAGLHFAVGYGCFEAGDLASAQPHLWTALRLEPSLHKGAVALASCLPARAVQALRWVKRSLDAGGPAAQEDESPWTVPPRGPAPPERGASGARQRGSPPASSS